jgi:hypothetical protein
VLWFRGSLRLPAVGVASLGLLSPLTAAVLGWAVLGQNLGPLGWLGFGLALGSVVLLQRLNAPARAVTDNDGPVPPSFPHAPAAPAPSPSLSLLSLTTPVAMGYIPLGMVFGFLFVQAGGAAWLAVLSSIVVYAGAAQYMMVPMLAAGLPVGAIALATAVVNLRHVFYGLSLLDRLPEQAWPALDPGLLPDRRDLFRADRPAPQHPARRLVGWPCSTRAGGRWARPWALLGTQAR